MNVSVAMATFQGRRFLRAQLDSLRSQTLLPLELIVCDDGSTDGTLEVLEEFAVDAPFPVQIVRNARRLGWRDNFFKAARLCQGSWIAFCDQDDVWLPHKLETLIREVRVGGDVVLVSHSARLVTSELRETDRYHPNHRRRRVIPSLRNHPLGVLAGFSICFRRSLIVGVDLESRPRCPSDRRYKLPHDRTILLLANVLGATIYIPDVLALHRRHSRTATKKEKGHDGRGILERFVASAGVGQDAYAAKARLSLEAGEWFDSLSSEAHDPSEAGRLREAAGHYERLASIYLLRAEIHGSAHGESPLRTILRAAGYGAYFSRTFPWSLGAAALVKDLGRATVRTFGAEIPTET